jgi:hypothetical protein
MHHKSPVSRNVVLRPDNHILYGWGPSPRFVGFILSGPAPAVMTVGCEGAWPRRRSGSGKRRRQSPKNRNRNAPIFKHAIKTVTISGTIGI